MPDGLVAVVAVIHDDAEAAVLVSGLEGTSPSHEEYPSQHRSVGDDRRCETVDVPARNDQLMKWGLGSEVLEGDDHVVLIGDRGRGLAPRDRAKWASRDRRRGAHCPLPSRTIEKQWNLSSEESKTIARMILTPG